MSKDEPSPFAHFAVSFVLNHPANVVTFANTPTYPHATPNLKDLARVTPESICHIFSGVGDIACSWSYSFANSLAQAER